MPAIRVLPELTGKVVRREVRRLGSGDEALFHRNHLLTDPLYEAGDPGAYSSWRTASNQRSETWI